MIDRNNAFPGYAVHRPHPSHYWQSGDAWEVFCNCYPTAAPSYPCCTIDNHVYFPTHYYANCNCAVAGYPTPGEVEPIPQLHLIEYWGYPSTTPYARGRNPCPNCEATGVEENTWGDTAYLAGYSDLGHTAFRPCAVCHQTGELSDQELKDYLGIPS